MTVQQRWAAVPNAHDGREAYLNHTVRLALFHTEVVEQPLMALIEIPQGCSSKFLTLGRV